MLSQALGAHPLPTLVPSELENSLTCLRGWFLGFANGGVKFEPFIFDDAVQALGLETETGAYRVGVDS